MANWLNEAFAGFDYALLKFGNDLHNSAGGFFDGFMKFITAFGDGGIILILIAIGLICFKKTRKIGLTMFGAIAIGALITNITIKPLVARLRPFANENSEFYEQFYAWWVAAGSVAESEYSFPSGHATASMAAMMAFFLAGNKKYSWTGFLLAILIGFSRIYLCVHYPSDVLFGFIVGIIAGALSYLIVWLLYKYLKGTKVGDFLYEKDVITLYKYIKNKCKKKKVTVTNSNSQEINDTTEEDNKTQIKATIVKEISAEKSDNSESINNNNDIKKADIDSVTSDIDNNKSDNNCDKIENENIVKGGKVACNKAVDTQNIKDN